MPGRVSREELMARWASGTVTMLKLLADEHIDWDLVRGLLTGQPDLDLVRVQKMGLLGADDRDILAWTAGQGRVLVTHDRNTFPGFAPRADHALYFIKPRWERPRTTRPRTTRRGRWWGKTKS